MKYAVVESGGKQYVAREGESVDVDRLPVQAGSSIAFDKVLLLVDGDQVQVGAPIVEGLKVQGTVSEHIQGPKIVVFRYIPKERYRRKTGHRQQYSRVKITAIGGADSKGEAEATKARSGEGPEEPRAGKAKPAAESKPAGTRTREGQSKPKPRAGQGGPRESQGGPRESQGRPTRGAKKTTKTTTAKKPSKK